MLPLKPKSRPQGQTQGGEVGGIHDCYQRYLATQGAGRAAKYRLSGVKKCPAPQKFRQANSQPDEEKGRPGPPGRPKLHGWQMVALVD